MLARHLPCLLTAVFALGCTEAATEPVASPVSTGASVTGTPVHQVVIGGPDVCSGFGAQPGCDANFSLLALQSADGSASGQWIDRFSQNFGGGGIFMTVDCLEVDGNRAWIGGHDPKDPGFRAVVYAEDRGTSYALEADDLFLMLYGVSQSCHDRPFAFGLSVAEGQVTIR